MSARTANARRDAREKKAGVFGYAVWLLLAVAILAGFGYITHNDTQSQINDEAASRAKSLCENQRIGREALRLVIERSFTSQMPVTLPTPPEGVNEATRAWIQSIVDQSSDNPQTDVLRKRLLDSVPPLKCDKNNLAVPVVKPKPPPTSITPPSTAGKSP